jgi:hypothetical protein
MEIESKIKRNNLFKALKVVTICVFTTLITVLFFILFQGELKPWQLERVCFIVSVIIFINVKFSWDVASSISTDFSIEAANTKTLRGLKHFRDQINELIEERENEDKIDKTKKM